MSPAERLRMMHTEPSFAVARDERGRERFKTTACELRRHPSNAARRGVDVPPQL